MDGKVVDNGFTGQSCDCPSSDTCAFCDVQSFPDMDYSMRLLSTSQSIAASVTPLTVTLSGGEPLHFNYATLFSVTLAIF